MTPENPIAFIFKSQHPIQNSILKWMQVNPTFFKFVTTYKDKIRLKVKNCNNDEQFDDLLWELDIAAYFLRNNELDVEIEYVTEGKGKRTPDFYISTNLGSFYAEATRIRSNSLEIRYRNWEKQLGEYISTIPSSVGVFLNTTIMSVVPNYSEKMISQLEDKLDIIKSKIKEKIMEMDVVLEFEEKQSFSILENLVSIDIIKPTNKRYPNETSYYGGTQPVLYTQKEYTKFGDILCNKLNQCCSGKANIIMIFTQNDTHDLINCEDAIIELQQRDDAFFQKKGFEGVDDFRNRYKNLSAIFFNSRWLGQGGILQNFDTLYPLDEKLIEFISKKQYSIHNILGELQ